MANEKRNKLLKLTGTMVSTLLVLAALATVGDFFGLSLPSQVNVINAKIEVTPPSQVNVINAKNEVARPSHNNSVEYIVRASGTGLASPKATSDAEQRQTALRAAHIVAKRNLVAYSQGADIEAVTIVVDNLLERDEIREVVKGRLADVETISETYDPTARKANVVLGIRRSSVE